MKKITKWQLEQLEKELRLLQGHLVDPSCPCQTDGEHCVRKHLITIAALATETLPIAKTDEDREMLKKLTKEAQSYANIESWKICHSGLEINLVSADWARNWAKRVEHRVTGACTITGGESYTPLAPGEKKVEKAEVLDEPETPEPSQETPPTPEPEDPEEVRAAEGGPTVVQEVTEESAAVEDNTAPFPGLPMLFPPLLPPLPHELLSKEDD